MCFEVLESSGLPLEDLAKVSMCSFFHLAGRSGTWRTPGMMGSWI